MNRTPTPKRMRPLWSLLAILLSFALIAAACGDDDEATEDPPAEEAEEAETDAEAEPAEEAASDEEAAPATDGDAPKLAVIYSDVWFDGSWGEAAYDGANELLEAGVISDLALQESVPPGAEAERALRAYAEDGFNPIIAHSFNYGDDVKKVAADYPETIFVYAGGFGDVAGNVGDYSQPFHETSYLSGILAAGVQGSGTVGGSAGFEIPVCYAMYEAFLLGVQEILPDTTGSFVAVGDWIDVQLAKEAALGQSADGATMFIGCGQGPTFGQIEAAIDEGGVATGYVGDMSDIGSSVLSSFVWELDQVFGLMVEDAANGVTEAQYYEVLLKDGGLSMAISPDWEIPSETMALYEERLAAIVDGSFEVPFIGEAA